MRRTTVPLSRGYAGAMTDAPRNDARSAWTIGGSLLVGAALWPILTQGIPIGAGLVSALLWAASLTVFALGIRREGSVVARRRLGVVTLLVAAIIPAATTLFWGFVVPMPSDAQWAVPLSQAIDLVLMAALAVAAVQIARAGAVPASARWLPLIAVIACVAAQAVMTAVALTPGLSQDVLLTVYGVGTLIFTITKLVVGLTAIVLAQRIRQRPAPEDVHVFPPVA